MKRKVVFAIDTNSSGGAERVIITLANYMSRHGCDVTIVLGNGKESFYSIDKSVKIVDIGLNWDKKGNFAAIRRFYERYVFLVKYLKKENPQALIAFLINMELPAILAGLRTKTRTFTSVRNSVQYYSKFICLFRKVFYPMISGVVFQSAKVRGDKDFVKLKNSRVIFNPLTEDIPEKLAPIPYAQRKNWVISVARLAPQKNHGLLIDAFCKIADRYPHTELHIFGEGKMRESLQKKIENTSCAERIYLEGIEKNAVYVHRDAKVFVMSSDHEGFPNALVEAMVCGIPSVSTDFDSGVASQLIQEGENGYLCPVGDSTTMAEKISKILNAQEKSQLMAEKATETFDIVNTEAVCEQWMQFIFQ